MRRFVSVSPLLVLAFLLAASAAPALAQAKEGTEARNVLVKVSLNRQDPDGTKTSRSVQLVVRIDGESGHVMESAQVAFPGQGEGGKTFAYQNVGLSLNLEALSAAGRSLRLHGKVDDTSVQGSSAPPIVRTWTLDLGDIVVTEGKPLEASALKAADGTWTRLVVEVDILD